MPKFGQGKAGSKTKTKTTGLAIAGMTLIVVGILLGVTGGLLIAGILIPGLSLIPGINPNFDIIIVQNGGTQGIIMQGQFSVTLQSTVNGSKWTYTLQQLMTGVGRFQPIGTNPISILCQLDQGCYTLTFPSSVLTSAGQFFPNQTLYSFTISPWSMTTISVTYTLQGGGLNQGNHETLTINSATGGTTLPVAGTYVDNGYGWIVYAIPNGGYKATGFILDGSPVAGIAGAVNGVPSLQITIVPSSINHVLTPVFTAVPVGNLTILAATHGTTSPTPGTYADNGGGWNVDAIADQGYVLDHWVLDGSNMYSMNGSTTISIPSSAQNHTLQPVFVATSGGGNVAPTGGFTNAMLGETFIAMSAVFILAGVAMLGLSARGTRK